MGNHSSSDATPCFREDYQGHMLADLASTQLPEDAKVLLVDVLCMRALQVGNYNAVVSFSCC